MSKKAVYISGPVTGVPNYWKPFEQAAAEIKASGMVPLSPTWQPQGLSKEQYMRMCMAMLDSADAVLFLPGWENSPGAQVEYSYAAYIGKTVATCDCPLMLEIAAEVLKEVLTDGD